MYSLPPPDRDGVKDFDSIVGIRNTDARAKLKRVRIGVLEAYTEYIKLSGNGELLEPLALDSESAHELRANFGLLDRGRSHSNIRDEILGIAYLDLCPYCSVATVESLDHSLPSSAYPEFSVLAQNIVPSCGRCNRVKSNVCYKTAGISLAHPYFVEYPVNPILFANVVVEQQSVTWDFYLQNNDDIDDDMFASIENLFSTLNLADLYGKHSTLEIMAMVDYIHNLFQTQGAVGLRQLLQGMADSTYRKQGANYWKTVLLRSLAESREFCNGGYVQLRTLNT